MIAAVDVIAPVFVAVHVNRNGHVDVIRTVDERTNHGVVDPRSEAQGSLLDV